ncbi:MAG: hypothetical protein KAR13_02995, partial [Desulfobulbaceae bacterium]|nr:hypothetical protein [Desulfobulbaceae bacterium]
ISHDARLPKLANRVYEIMFPESPHTVDELRAKRYNFFHLLVRDNVIDTIRYLLRLIFRPTNVEWLWLRLPASLSFLYYFLRPLRLGFFKKVGG